MIKFILLIRALRIKEIIVKTAFMYIGVLFAFPQINGQLIINLFLIFVPAFFTLLSIYCFNAGFGYEYDRNNLRLANLSIIDKNIYVSIAVIFFILSGITLSFFDYSIFSTGMFIMIAWLLYSLPTIGLKYYPFTGLLIAFITQIAQFHVGYLLYNEQNLYSLLISIYFALLVGAGHLLHEIIDYDPDKEAGFKTTAGYLGIKKVKNIIFLLHFTAFLYFVVLTYLKVLDVKITVFFLIANISQGFILLVQPKINPTFYRRIYLFLYLLACCATMLMYYFFSNDSIR